MILKWRLAELGFDQSLDFDIDLKVPRSQLGSKEIYL
jgi:hypothetical protein